MGRQAAEKEPHRAQNLRLSGEALASIGKISLENAVVRRWPGVHRRDKWQIYENFDIEVRCGGQFPVTTHQGDRGWKSPA